MRFLRRSVAAFAALAGGLTVLALLALSGGGGQQGGCGAAAPVTAGQLTSGQQQFAGELAARTGLDADVIAAWELQEQNGANAAARQAANNNDWLDVGYTNSATYGAGDSVWSNPITAADATAAWLHGLPAVPGYPGGAPSVQAILTTAGQPAAVQIAAIQGSGFATSGERDLPGLYASVVAASGSSTTSGAVPVSAQGGAIDQTTATSYIAGLAGVKVGYAIVSAGGQVLAQHDATMQVPGASITKAMLLVAYLDQVGRGPVPATAAAHLQAMIEISSNPDGSWVFAQVGAAAVERVAAAAGMTGFRLDTSDPEYTLGQSLVSAADFARFFAVIDQLMPAANRAYGMGLLADISAGDHWGILDANVGAGASKAGWKTEPGAGWVVNQAAQLQLQGQTVGIAVTSEGSASLPAGETIMQTVATDLLAGTAAATGVLASDQIGCAAQASGTFVDGGVASILPDGEATIPQGAPAAVQAAIEAGNEIIDKPYVYGGGHSQPLTTIAASYDCSSSTSFALHGGGLLDATPEDSTELESYGQPGAGQWITVYANPIHAYIEVAGIYLDTAAGQGRPPNPPTTGPRWTPVGSGPAGFTARHPAGL